MHEMLICNVNPLVETPAVKKRGKAMNWIDYWINYEDEDMEKLRQAGFTERVIIRLRQMRRSYAQDEMDQLPLDRCRLEFVRWLVTTGRLSDHCI